MRRHLLMVIALFMATGTFAQLTGVKTIPGNYATIAAAVTALNTSGVGAGGVTFNVNAGHTETNVNILLTTTTASAANPIIFQKSGTGANPLVTAGVGTSATLDAIIKIRGTDYVTFDGIDVLDPATNATATTRMEFGYAILMTSATDASQYITIKNCSITLQKAYTASPYSSGIYSKNHTDASTTTITPTSANGVVSNCRIDNCNISNVIYGINWTGSSSATYYGQNNYFGFTTGNTITNFGGGAVTPYGMYFIYQTNLKVANNTVNGGTGTTTSMNGIYVSTGTNANTDIYGNQVTLTYAATTSSVNGIYNSSGGTGTNNQVNIYNNTVTINWPTCTTGTLYGIYHTASAYHLEYYGNSVSNCVQGSSTATSTGSFYGIYSTGSNTTAGSIWNIYSNNLNNNTRVQSAYSSGTVYGIYNSSSGLTCNITGNNSYSNLWPGTGTVYNFYIVNSSATTLNISNNTVHDVSKPNAVTNVLPRSGTLYGIYLSGSAANSLTTVQDNIIYNLTNTWGGQLLPMRADVAATSTLKIIANKIYGISSNDQAVFGIYNSTGLNVDIYKNRLYDVKAAIGDTGCFYGICTGSSTSGSTTTVYNNFISDCSANEANVYLSAGLYLFGSTAGTNFRYYDNTVYLNQVPTAGNPSTAAIFANTAPNLDMRNNILVNNSTIINSGMNMAFWRSSTVGGTYSSSSNFNCMYAGNPGPSNLIFYASDVTAPVSAQTISAYHALFPQEAQSFTEFPPFLNVAVKPYNLHLDTTMATMCESGGSIISAPSITTDYDDQPRYPNPGYPNNSNFHFWATSPDVGADEFGGIPNFTCTNPAPGNTQISTNNICLGSSVTFSMQFPPAGTGIIYQWQVSTDGITFSNIAGANASTYTTTPAGAYYYQCVVTCQVGPVTGTSTPVQVTFANQVLSTTPGNRCGTGTVVLEATSASGSAVKWYNTITGGTSIFTGSPFTTPSISSTTTYYVGAETVSPGNVSVGTSTTNQNTTSSYPAVYGAYWESAKHQMLILASELTAAGVQPGNITQIGFDVVSVGSSGVHTDFTIKMAATTLNALTTTYVTGLTTVFGPVNYQPVNGINTHVFSTPFVWNGTSNIVVETCFSNDPTGSGIYYTVNAIINRTTTSFNSVAYYYGDDANNCPGTTASNTSTSRPNMIFPGMVTCSSNRLPVIATVTPPPALTLTTGQLLCPDEIFQINVTSNLADYEIYTWSPVTNLYTDAACTTPYVAGNNYSTVYFKSSAVSTTYTCTASNSVSLCSNSAQITLSALPNATITSIPGAICITGSATLKLSPATGYYTAQFQWQESPDNSTFNDITGATSQNYITPVLTQTHYYRVLVKKPDGSICLQPSYTMIVGDPQLLTTTPGSRCGTGTVTLSATSNAGSSIRWYAASSGGTALGTGGTFVTPTISTTTSYYATATLGGVVARVGKTAIESNASGTVGGLSSYLAFTALSDFTLQTVDVFPYGTGAGTVTVELRTGTGVSLMTKTFNVTGTQSTASPAQTLELNFPITGGADYRLGVLSWTGLVTNMYRDNTNLSYPYSLTNILNITGTDLGTTYYYFYYNWLVSTACESPRQAVTATVTAPPSISVSATPSTICNGQSASLSASSSNPGYTYLWTPGNLSGANQTVSPNLTTSYTVVASDAGTGCATTGNASVTVLAAPGALTITPPAPVISFGDIQQLTVSGGDNTGNITMGTGISTNGTTTYPAPYTNYYGGAKHQMLIRASELTAAGLTAGSKFNQISFFVQSVGSTFTGSLSNFQVDLGLTSSTVLTSTSFLSGLTNVFSASTITVAVGTNTHAFASPFTWDGTSNLVVQTSYSNANTGTSTDYVLMYNSDPGFVSTNYYRADGATAAAILAAATPSGSGNARPNMVLGYSLSPTFLWTPSTSLYTDATATTPYSGQSLTVVYAKPSATITYNCTGTFATTGCSKNQAVTVTLLNACAVPLSVNTTGVSYTSAVLNWIEPTPVPSSGYEFEVRTSGEAGSGSTGLVSSGTTASGVTSVPITGLAPSTLYHTYLRSNCGDNVYSLWTSDYQFTTLTPLLLSISGTKSNANCHSVCDGTINTTTTGGVSPYTYLWSDGSTLENRVNLCAGIYSVTVFDALSTIASNSFIIMQPDPIGVVETITDASCYGETDGAINIAVTGGTPPYSYTWADMWGVFSYAQNINGLGAGEYYLTVMDSHGCLYADNYMVNQPYMLQVTAFAGTVSCYGGNNGSINIFSVDGGTPPYTYSWTGPNGYTSNSQNISGLYAGNYYLTVADSHGCTAVTWRDVTQPDQLVVSGTATNASCPGATNGSISTSVSGGTPGYTYLWSTSATTADITALAAGNYTVSVTDMNSCTVSQTWTVGLTNPVCAAITVSGTINALPAVCYNATSTITVAGTGTVFEVSGAGRATFIAGSKISYLPGTKVYGGGYMLGKIYSGSWCATSKMTEVAAGPEEQPAVTERANFNLYPNPTNGNFTIVQKGENPYNNVKIDVYSMSGEKVMTGNMVGQKHEFNLSSMASGIYFVKVVADGYVETIKLVKTR